MPEEYISKKAESAAGSQAGHSAAFVIESLFLLLFIAASVAVTVQMLGLGYSQGAQAKNISSAVVAASNCAEDFVANPGKDSVSVVYRSGADGELEKLATLKGSTPSETVSAEGGDLSVDDPSVYVATRKVKTEENNAGVLYNAEIYVTNQGKEVYTIKTSRYVSDDGGVR